MAEIPTSNPEIDEAAPSILGRVLRKMWHLRLGVLGGLLILCLVFIAFFCPYLSPHDPFKQDITKRL